MKALRLAFLFLALLLPIRAVLAGGTAAATSPAALMAQTAHCHERGATVAGACAGDTHHLLGDLACDQHCAIPVFLHVSSVAPIATGGGWPLAPYPLPAGVAWAPPRRPPRAV
ncbi:MAG: hypothetical protein JO171_06160 [Paludibacterium sp.]|uniref:hypothetical protein n=1 Tax=Paludibacterium sp. TaxID=1917523 RepID=UPI0025E1F08E|nr:hypothetical protein [Paludibacterium sp.]MBV8046715.1 hypothetical protein [Paludibacterium sp.]MBV8646806.1 hypothetical protein [Paludibacterium sp.]